MSHTFSQMWKPKPKQTENMKAEEGWTSRKEKKDGVKKIRARVRGGRREVEADMNKR